MSENFETQLRLQLRAAAQREERRGAFSRRAAHARLSLPAAPMVAAATLAVALLVAIVVVGGLRWGGDEPVTAPRVVADVALADNLGAISSGSGAVWTVDTATNQVLRLDPRTRRVQARVGIGGPATVTAGAGAVWALTERRLLRIDPATNRITARTALRLPGGAPLSPFDVQILGGVPWIVGLEGALAHQRPQRAHRGLHPPPAERDGAVLPGSHGRQSVGPHARRAPGALRLGHRPSGR